MSCPMYQEERLTNEEVDEMIHETDGSKRINYNEFPLAKENFLTEKIFSSTTAPHVPLSRLSVNFASTTSSAAAAAAGRLRQR
uniref:Uncharacterized protein n=1 Tax=Oryza nivara TaxID=4536 RepID=A0A0E0J474_ORYNI